MDDGTGALPEFKVATEMTASTSRETKTMDISMEIMMTILLMPQKQTA